MPVARPRQVLPVDTALAVGVGLLAFASTRWQPWWDEPDRRAGVPMRHGGPPFRAPTLEPTSTAWSVPWLVALAIAAIVAGLMVRRVFPRSGYVTVVVATAAFLAAGGPYGPVLLAAVLAVLGMGATLPLRSWTPWLAALPIMLSAGFWRQPYGGLLDPAIWPAALFGTAAIILPALLIVLRRARRDADLRDRQVERERYLYAERMRIAREVHDVVGHSLSVIHLQSGVALHVLDKRPEQVAAALEAIRATSKDALAELRHTLGVFRDADGPDPTAPQAGLARLDELVAPLRAAGRSVDVRVVGDLRHALPAVIDHAAYRIVQEALTNVVRHTDGATVHVGLTVADGSLRIVVADDGPRVSDGDLQPGNGIRGMRERAAAVGGQLEVRPRAPHGTRVEAILPIAIATADP
ncbi:MAG TPA: sensor histidine kinase [Microlunatus sp.]|nr:sensor histidine kinase [Microlunatus sp.]